MTALALVSRYRSPTEPDGPNIRLFTCVAEQLSALSWKLASSTSVFCVPETVPPETVVMFDVVPVLSAASMAPSPVSSSWPSIFSARTVTALPTNGAAGCS